MTAGSDFVGYLVSAGGAVSIFLLIAVWTIRAPRSPYPRRLLIASGLSFALLSIFGIQLLFARILSGTFTPFDVSQIDPSRTTAIVVLGSGSVVAEDWDGRTLSFVDRAAAIRLTEAVRVFRLVNPAAVVASGGDPHARRKGAPTGETMKDALVAAGVPHDRILVETQSRTTRDEAVVVAPILRARGITQVILVTSGLHMRRALGTFRAEGVPAIPAIAHEFSSDISLAFVLIPSKEGLGLAAENVHETLALAYYWFRGWWQR
ncbi:MAG TPA: YdcF family protein [Vicinamibacterales bacterium]